MLQTPAGGLVAVYRSPSASSVDERALVLVSVGIRCTISQVRGAPALFVDEQDAPRAREQLVRYAEENHRRHETRSPVQPLSDGLTPALAYVAVLWAVYVLSVRQTLGRDWIDLGAATSGAIMAGDLWRPITALTLHADISHLSGNLFFGAMFGLLLSQALGSGVAWLALLVAGILANILNAALQPASHSAIGASTAVFGALGILCGLAWYHRLPHWPHGLRRWVPLAAGIMLLVFLGIEGERTDIAGHVLGLVVGAVMGALMALLPRSTWQRPRRQSLAGVAAFALVVAAWLAALV
jgi:rhomboid protease GluP